MLRRFVLVVVLALLCAPLCVAQETPQSLVDGYDALADTILALRRAEAGFVGALLDAHHRAAAASRAAGDWQRCAAEIALFANEGDNAVGGVRKKLLEGGHHYNADGEEQGLFEPGYVIVTKQAKVEILTLAKAMRGAADEAGRERAWQEFEAIARRLHGDE